MSEKKLYTHRRWHEPPKAEVIGYREIPEEERKENRKILRRLMRENGFLKEDDKEEE